MASKIKKAAQRKVVSAPVLALPTPGPAQVQRSEGLLEPAKKKPKRPNVEIIEIGAAGLSATEPVPDSEPAFLRRAMSVSRYKPPYRDLVKWAREMRDAAIPYHHSGCLISLRCPSQDRPVKTFHNPNKPGKKNDGLPIAVVMVLSDERYPQYEWDQVSHLCGVPRCIRLEHLLWEEASKNVDRNKCQMYGIACSHEPACIMLTAEDRRRINALLARTLTK